MCVRNNARRRVEAVAYRALGGRLRAGDNCIVRCPPPQGPERAAHYRRHDLGRLNEASPAKLRAAISVSTAPRSISDAGHSPRHPLGATVRASPSMPQACSPRARRFALPTVIGAARASPRCRGRRMIESAKWRCSAPSQVAGIAARPMPACRAAFDIAPGDCKDRAPSPRGIARCSRLIPPPHAPKNAPDSPPHRRNWPKSPIAMDRRSLRERPMPSGLYIRSSGPQAGLHRLSTLRPSPCNVSKACPPPSRATSSSPFFNPPRYLRLLEIVTGPKTRPRRGRHRQSRSALARHRSVQDNAGLLANRLAFYGAMRRCPCDAEGFTSGGVRCGPPLGAPTRALRCSTWSDRLMPHLLPASRQRSPRTMLYAIIASPPDQGHDCHGLPGAGQGRSTGSIRSARQGQEDIDLLPSAYRAAGQPKTESVAKPRAAASAPVSSIRTRRPLHGVMARLLAYAELVPKSPMTPFLSLPPAPR